MEGASYKEGPVIPSLENLTQPATVPLFINIYFLFPTQQEVGDSMGRISNENYLWLISDSCNVLRARFSDVPRHQRPVPGHPQGTSSSFRTYSMSLNRASIALHTNPSDYTPVSSRAVTRAAPSSCRYYFPNCGPNPPVPRSFLSPQEMNVSSLSCHEAPSSSRYSSMP